MLYIKTEKEIEKMRAAGRLAAEILAELESKIKPGVSTLELNDFANELTVKAGAVSAPYLYKTKPTDTPFPKHICTSINNVVCHGVPKEGEYLKEGDIINCDLTVILDGYHGDTSRTFAVGKIIKQAQKLLKRTRKALEVGIKAVKIGGETRDIGIAIEKFIKPYKYGIVEQLTGHGIGSHFHEEPSIHHFKQSLYSWKIKPGMTFTIEPMINLGTKDVVLAEDKWSILTVDGKLSAQFEHTLAVTDKKIEILTKL
jgi:methionyl aminopeptidase